MALATTHRSEFNQSELVASGAVRVSGVTAVRNALSSDRALFFVAIALAVLQIADGVLTASGISKLGTAAEGNVMLRALMEAWGTIPALIVVKSLAILTVVALVTLASQVKWIKEAMAAVVAVYMLAAILPWSYIHAVHLF